MHMVINKTNQILDFDERHCINEYKSAYVLRCRSTIKTNGAKYINIFKKYCIDNSVATLIHVYM